MAYTLGGLGRAAQPEKKSKSNKNRGILGALLGPSGFDPLGLGHATKELFWDAPVGLVRAAQSLAPGGSRSLAPELGRGVLSSLAGTASTFVPGLDKGANWLGHKAWGDKWMDASPLNERAAERGLASALVEDIGNLALGSGTAVAIGKTAGTSGARLAALGAAVKEGERIGMTSSNIARAGAAGAKAAQAGERLGGTTRIGRALKGEGTLAEAGVSGPRGRAIAKASMRLARKTEADGAIPTAPSKAMEAAITMSHPYREVWRGVVRPAAAAGSSVKLAATAENAAQAAADTQAAQVTADAERAAKAADRAASGPAGREAAAAAEEAALLSGAPPEDAAQIGRAAAAKHAEEVTRVSQAEKAAAAAAKAEAEAALMENAIAPRQSLVAERMAQSAAEPLPGWAQRFAAGENRAGRAAAKLGESATGQTRVVEGLDWINRKAQAMDTGAMLRERRRFMEMDRRNLFHHEAVTASKAAMQRLMDEFGETRERANVLVGDQLMFELENRNMLIASKAMGLEGTEFEKLLNDAVGRRYPMPKEQVAALRGELDLALEQWRGLADERYNRLLGSPGMGAKGLDQIDVATWSPQSALTPKQHKLFNQKLREYKRLAGQDGAIRQQAVRFAKEILANQSTMDKLVAHLTEVGDQLEGQRARVVEEAMPIALTESRIDATVAVLTDMMGNGGTLDPHTGAIVNRSTGAQAAVAVVGEVIPEAEFAADPGLAVRNFVEKYRTVLVDPDAQIGIWQHDGAVYLDVSQTTWKGQTLTREQAAVLGMARGEKAIWDFTRGEFGDEMMLPNDAVSMAVASQHAAEIGKPGSQFNRVLREMNRARTQLETLQTQGSVAGALWGAAEHGVRLNPEAWDELGQVMMRQAVQGVAVGAAQSLDAWYGKIAVEARKTAAKNPAEALMQVYMSPDLNTAMSNLPEAWNQAMRQVGPDGKKAMDWYLNAYDTVATRFPEDHVTSLPRRQPDGSYVMTDVSTRELIWSVMAVTSFNSNPLANMQATFEGLLGLSEAPFSKTGTTLAADLADAIDEYARLRRDPASRAKGWAGESVEASGLAANKLWELIGKRVPHLNGVRADVLDILTERLLPEWDNEWVLGRIGREVPAKLQGLDETAAMDALGSTAYAKIRNFYNNMSDPTAGGVTLDRVMAQAFGMTSEAWDGEVYGKVKQMVTDLAEEMSAYYGVPILPHQAQALLWVGTKSYIAETEIGRRYAPMLDALDEMDNGVNGFLDGTDPISQWYAEEAFAVFGPEMGQTQMRTQEIISVRDLAGRTDVAVEPQSGLTKKAKEVLNAEARERLRDSARSKRTFAQQVGGDLYAKLQEPNEPQRILAQAEAWNKKRVKIAALMEKGKVQAAQDEIYSWISGIQSDFHKPAEYFSDFVERGGQQKVRGIGTAGERTARDARAAGLMGTPGQAPSASAVPENIGQITGSGFEDITERLAARWQSEDVNGLAQAADDISNGLTYTNTQTGRITMRFFRTADPTTLLHENAHLLRQMLPADDLRLLNEAYGARGGARLPKGKQGFRVNEERFAEDVIRHLSGGAAPPGLENVFARIQSSLASWWQGFGGEVNPDVAAMLNRWLDPEDVEAIPAPALGKDFDAMTTREIARAVRPRPGETRNQAMARGQRIGQMSEKTRELQADLAATTARLSKLQEATESMIDTFNSTDLPAAAQRQRRLDKLAGKMEKTLGDANKGPMASKVPPTWQPVAAAIDSLRDLATKHPDPAVRATFADMLADVPDTLSEFITYAIEQGLDPTHVSHMSDERVTQLVYGRFAPGVTELESGTRQLRKGNLPGDRSVEALLAAHLDVIREANTNQLVQDIERTIAIPIAPGDAIPKGYVAWDSAKRFLNTEQDVDAGVRRAVSPGGPSYIVPEQVANVLKHSTRNYDHWLLQGSRRVLHPWRTMVLTLTPRWYANNVIGNFILATKGGVRLEDWVNGYKSWRHGEDELAEIYHQVSGESLTDDIGAQGMAPLPAIRGEGSGGKLAKANLGRVKFLESVKKGNHVVDGIARSAAYFAGKRMGMSEQAALQHALQSLVDYGDLGPMERSLVKAAVPFYAWQKGIFKIVMKYPVDHPVRAALMMQLGRLNQELMADLPDRYRSGIPVPFGGPGALLDARAANPFADASALVSPSGWRESMNPVLRALANNAFDSPETGYPEKYRIDQYGRAMPTTDVAEDLAGIVTGLPQARLAEEGTGGVGPFLGVPRLRGDTELDEVRLRLQKSRAKQAGETFAEAGIPSEAKERPLSKKARARMGLPVPPRVKLPKPLG